MILNFSDWIIIIVFFIVLVIISFWGTKNVGKASAEYFLAGRNMPWWLLGVSMVATTFSCDTPNLVANIVRQNGVAGNWIWWAFLLTGMLTVFIYAKLWRRTKVFTDLEFYEIRYNGKLAAFLRGFRALYLGIIFNVIIIASVSLALIKISAVMMGWKPAQTLIIASLIVVVYSTIGGLKSVLITDFFQFFVAMAGSIAAAIILLNLPALNINGIQSLLHHENVVSKLDFFPSISKKELFIGIIVLPFAIQWWSVWYPGAEPGGGGYIAQRMLSAKSEKGAVAATLFFNVAHYALRPWPWIIVALASLVVFPDLPSIQKAFPDVNAQYIGHDMAYPAMLKFLPHGIIGLVVASLIAAFMSTVSTQLNWGSSYLAYDFYKRFIKPGASEKEIVLVGRICTVVLMFFSILVALLMSNALQAFNILLQVGAGTGLIYILRWFWWRISAYSEISGMIVSFLVAIYLELIHERLGFAKIHEADKLIIGVSITTFTWILVTILTKAEDTQVLKNFYKLAKPGGPGWKKIRKEMISEGEIIEKENTWDVPNGLLGMLVGCVAVYSALFATGSFIYGHFRQASLLSALAIIATFVLFLLWKRLKIDG